MTGEREDEQALTPALSLLGERGRRKEPRWVVPFLRALERSGEARTAAKDAGIDFSTAYARRRAHGEFADAWAEALRVHKLRAAEAEAEELAAFKASLGPSTISSSGNGPPPPGELGEDLTVSSGQVKRVGHGRWSKSKEKIFFDELAATANATRAAEAAGVSANAVFARRLKHPLFAAKWDAVVRTARASIDLHLVEEAKKSFDPATLQTGEVTPRITIDQAIKISQLNASKKAAAEPLPDPFAEEAASMTEDDVAELKERILRKLRRMRDRDMPGMIARGWSYDAEFDQMVPPGWGRAEG